MGRSASPSHKQTGTRVNTCTQAHTHLWKPSTWTSGTTLPPPVLLFRPHPVSRSEGQEWGSWQSPSPWRRGSSLGRLREERVAPARNWKTQGPAPPNTQPPPWGPSGFSSTPRPPAWSSKPKGVRETRAVGRPHTHGVWPVGLGGQGSGSGTWTVMVPKRFCCLEPTKVNYWGGGVTSPSGWGAGGQSLWLPAIPAFLLMFHTGSQVTLWVETDHTAHGCQRAPRGPSVAPVGSRASGDRKNLSEPSFLQRRLHPCRVQPGKRTEPARAVRGQGPSGLTLGPTRGLGSTRERASWSCPNLANDWQQ